VLHPDLVPHVYDNGSFTFLSHPIVILPLFNKDSAFDIRRANTYFERKREDVVLAVNEKNWGRVLMLHEKPYKVDALLHFAEHMTDEQFNESVKDVWNYVENNSQAMEQWHDLLTDERIKPELLMDEDELAVLAALSDVVTVYRGYSEDGTADGYSWTLDKAQARWFATRLAQSDELMFLRTIAVPKRRIIFYDNSRGEAEVVIAEPARWALTDDEEEIHHG
jgi:hypothetical protein